MRRVKLLLLFSYLRFISYFYYSAIIQLLIYNDYNELIRLTTRHLGRRFHFHKLFACAALASSTNLLTLLTSSHHSPPLIILNRQYTTSLSLATCTLKWFQQRQRIFLYCTPRIQRIWMERYPPLFIWRIHSRKLGEGWLCLEEALPPILWISGDPFCSFVAL